MLKLKRMIENPDGTVLFSQKGPQFSGEASLYNYAKSTVHMFDVGDYMVFNYTEGTENEYGLLDYSSQLLVDWMNEFEEGKC